MKYTTGEKIIVGDLVELHGQGKGIVVCSLDENNCLEDFKLEDWEYLETGVLIKIETGEIIYCGRADEDLTKV